MSTLTGQNESSTYEWREASCNDCAFYNLQTGRCHAGAPYQPKKRPEEYCHEFRSEDELGGPHRPPVAWLKKRVPKPAAEPVDVMPVAGLVMVPQPEGPSVQVDLGKRKKKSTTTAGYSSRRVVDWAE